MIMTQIFEESEEHTHPDCMSSDLAMVQCNGTKVPGNKFFISLACFVSFENINAHCVRLFWAWPTNGILSKWNVDIQMLVLFDIN